MPVKIVFQLEPKSSLLITKAELGSGLLFCRFSFLTDDIRQVIITHVVNDLLKFLVRSGAFCGRIGAAADVGNGHSGQFGDPPPKPVCA